MLVKSGMTDLREAGGRKLEDIKTSAWAVSKVMQSSLTQYRETALRIWNTGRAEQSL